MVAEEEERAAIVVCTKCGTPGIVKFKGEEMTQILIVCKCPRWPVGRANAEARRKVSRSKERRAMRSP